MPCWSRLANCTSRSRPGWNRVAIACWRSTPAVRAAAQQLVDKLAAEDDDTGMISFALKMFDEIGVNQDDRGENALVLTPGDHMLVSSFPGLPQDGMTITFDRNTALSRDDMALLSWDHPMMRGGIDLILGSEIGATSVALLKNKALPIGSILLELIFVAESAAHPQLYRFMPPTPIRLLMDKNGQNLGEKVAFDAFNRQLTPVNRHLGSKLVTASQPVIHGLIGKGQAIAEELKGGIVDKARAQMAQTLHRIWTGWKRSRRSTRTCATANWIICAICRQNCTT